MAKQKRRTCAVFILLVLILWRFSGNNGQSTEALKNHKWNDGKGFHGHGGIAFDLTKELRIDPIVRSKISPFINSRTTTEKYNGKTGNLTKEPLYDSSLDRIDLSSYAALGKYLPTQFYYDATGDISGNARCPEKLSSTLHIRPCAVAGISLMFNTKATKSEIANLSISPHLDNITHLINGNSSTLTSVVISSAPFYCSKNIRELIRYLTLINAGRNKKLGADAVKLGLEYSQEFFKDDCEQHVHALLQQVDFAILRVDLMPTMLSYGFLTEIMNGIVRLNKELFHKFNLRTPLYFRFILKNPYLYVSGQDEFSKYRYLIHKNIVAWKEVSMIKGTFIMSPSPVPAAISENRKFLQENVTATIYCSARPTAEENDKSFITPDSPCESVQVVTPFQSIFKTIMLVDPKPSFVKKMIALNENASNPATEAFNVQSTKFKVILYENASDFDKQIQVITETPGGFHTVYIQFSEAERSKENQQQLVKTVKLIQSKGIQFGCYISDLKIKMHQPELYNPTENETCGAVSSLFTQVMYPVDASIYADFLEVEMYHFLKDLLRFKEVYDSWNPGKQLVPLIKTTGMIFRKPAPPYPLFLTLDERHQFYCNAQIKSANEYIQIMLAYANIHNWTNMALYVDSHRDIHNGLWRNVETSSDVDRKVTTFPVYFRSNSEETVDGAQLPMTFPCIYHTQVALQKRMHFLQNVYSGATFSIKLRHSSDLTNKELQIALLFTLDRFSSVEMLANRLDDFTQAIAVWSPDVVYSVNASRDSRLPANTTLLFTELPLNVVASLKHAMITAIAKKQIAVHVTGWEPWATGQSANFKIPPKFGLTVENCSDEMNKGLARLKNLSFISSVSYLVCNVKPVVPNNSDLGKMLSFLGTLFYTKSYMEHHLCDSSGSSAKCPVEVMFRINLDSTTRQCPDMVDEERKDFLRFLNDTNQHSAAFKIRYFIVRAFVEESSSINCPHSWWRLNNYSDLSNQNTYVDRESEYIGAETKLGIQLLAATPTGKGDAAEDSASGQSYLYWYTIVPLVIIFLLTIATLLIKLYRAKKAFLTEREIQQFRNGYNSSGNDLELTNFNSANTMYLKFLEAFEISEWDIDLQGMIGCGQFGIVRRGSLTNHGQVAIKIPRSDCGKEQFLSTLSELKILCYIGSHPNIVEFLGACTKKIKSGKLYIVTEFCDNGSLQDYLRKLQNPDPNCQQNSSVELSQLYGFAHQIACGMEYVTERRVVHGDVATRNVLLTLDFTCKIADFGLSRRLYELNEYVKTSKQPLPWRWMAPESLKNMEFTFKSDVWSYGVTLWEIFSLGAVPYPGKTFNDEFLRELENGYQMGKAEYAPDDVHDAVSQCWNISKEDRPSFTDFKKYFAGLLNKEYLQINE